MSQQPDSSSSTSEPRIELSKRTQQSSILVAIVFFIFAGLVLYNPPASVTVKQDEQGQVERTTSRTSDSAVPIAVFAAATGLLLFALNGRHLARISAGPVGMESDTTSNLVKNVKTAADIAQLPESKQQPITDDDVFAAFKKIPDFSGLDLAAMSSHLRLALLFNQIVTKGQLEELVSSTGILNTLRWLYIRVLQRPSNQPLDPMAVAVWGSILYRLGLNDDVIRALEVQLRASPEYHAGVAAGRIKP